MTGHAWRIGAAAWCGANLVRIAALDGGRALVVGGGLFGPWTIWMDAAQLKDAEMQEEAALPPVYGMKQVYRAPKFTAGHPNFTQLLQRRNDAPNLH
jgi:hypothetical protein